MNARRISSLQSSRFSISGPGHAPRSVCEAILRALPDWFGIEDSLIDYAKSVESMPTFVASVSEETIGFVTIERHFRLSAEVYVIAVHPDHHRSGVGRALLDSAKRWLRSMDVEFLQVKTLGPSRACEHYERTRKFYEGVGFRPLEEMKTLWNKANPCLLMVMSLKEG